WPRIHCRLLSQTFLSFPLRFLDLSRVFFFTDTATTEIYTLSLHDALPIWFSRCRWTVLTLMKSSSAISFEECPSATSLRTSSSRDRKSTRLNSSHVKISYAVFCLKKKKKSLKTSAEMHTARPVN